MPGGLKLGFATHVVKCILRWPHRAVSVM